METDDFPSERNLHLWLGFSMAMLNNQRVILASAMLDYQIVSNLHFIAQNG